MARVGIAVAVLCVVVAVECVVAAYMIPSADQVESQIKARAEEEKKKAEEAKSESALHATEAIVGKFNITIHKPEAESTMRIGFSLVATVLEKDVDDFTNLFKGNEHRLRDQVIFEIRNSETADLTDPGLGLIKRRILAKSNELLGRPIIQSVVFSEFTYTQQ
jgi:hypothetical protein